MDHLPSQSFERVARQAMRPDDGVSRATAVTRCLPTTATECAGSPRNSPQRRPHEISVAASHCDHVAYRPFRGLPWAQGVAGLARRSGAKAASNPVAPTRYPIGLTLSVSKGRPDQLPSQLAALARLRPRRTLTRPHTAYSASSIVGRSPTMLSRSTAPMSFKSISTERRGTSDVNRLSAFPPSSAIRSLRNGWRRMASSSPRRRITFSTGYV